MPPTPTLFQKLFNKKNGLISPCKELKEECVFSWPLPEFDPSQIRLIVYQDCERRGRNVLFDSSAKRRTEDAPVSKLCSDPQVRVFGKCCQLRPGGDSSSSLDSSINSSSSSSETKEQGQKFQEVAGPGGGVQLEPGSYTLVIVQQNRWWMSSRTGIEKPRNISSKMNVIQVA